MIFSSRCKRWLCGILAFVMAFTYCFQVSGPGALSVQAAAEEESSVVYIDSETVDLTLDIEGSGSFALDDTVYADSVSEVEEDGETLYRKVSYSISEFDTDETCLYVDVENDCAYTIYTSSYAYTNAYVSVNKTVALYADESCEGEAISEESSLYQTFSFVIYINYLGMEDVTLSDSDLYIYNTDYTYSEDEGVATTTFENTPYTLSSWDGMTDIYMESSNSDFDDIYYYVEDNVLTIETTQLGTTELTFTVNGEKFVVNLTVTTLDMVSTKLIAKGKKSKLKITATCDDTSVCANTDFTWSSSDTSVVSVSKKGKITAKKKGNAIIYATNGYITLGCAVSVASKKTVKAIKKAIWIGDNCTYSQARRMQSAYYDCSSLVFRAYKSAGIKVVWKGSYAPVAASIAYWLVKTKGHKLYKYTNKRIQKMKFYAGDLGFQTGASNGRYKGIYHVEMFIGYSYIGSKNGKAVLLPRWANRYDGYTLSVIAHF
ncbi:MAG: Ig-like domain-containing protein [Eubacterium sp.]|nr:Ig-like domain-containing protein [Eubacterium sp.]